MIEADSEIRHELPRKGLICEDEGLYDIEWLPVPPSDDLIPTCTDIDQLRGTDCGCPVRSTPQSDAHASVEDCDAAGGRQTAHPKGRALWSISVQVGMTPRLCDGAELRFANLCRIGNRVGAGVENRRKMRATIWRGTPNKVKGLSSSTRTDGGIHDSSDVDTPPTCGRVFLGLTGSAPFPSTDRMMRAPVLGRSQRVCSVVSGLHIQRQ
ncbi:hypothetical protein SJ05684_c17280 [Sinorhizobium sojae CCBAU 05684]|uniref:Uncharacterized protein n=1 Tax=Sinorhizobium sojae CCBAU 05684 TaxID=716928 RepID=A0A249PB43_9HYPH|nr:hypothetical protein SJ05684_c17280 [Sinorhizobium sojae CCBAU 05684]